jgi:hypothetical protein
MKRISSFLFNMFSIFASSLFKVFFRCNSDKNIFCVKDAAAAFHFFSTKAENACHRVCVCVCVCVWIREKD